MVVEQIRWKDGKARLSGFRDPLAAPPETVLSRHGLAPASFELTPFVSLDPRIVERRARTVLRPPESVSLSVEGHELHIGGTAGSRWVDDARLLGRTIPGVEHVDDGALRTQESLEAVHTAASKVEAPAIKFAIGRSELVDQDAMLKRAVDRARGALQAAADARVGACLVVTGHTDASGTAERNDSLSVDRAKTVSAQLASMGIAGGAIRPVGTRPMSDPLVRSVTFRVDVDESRFTPGCGGGP
jgi:hypothetical protein